MFFRISPLEHLCPVRPGQSLWFSRSQNVKEHSEALSSVPFFSKRHYLNMTEQTVRYGGRERFAGHQFIIAIILR